MIRTIRCSSVLIAILTVSCAADVRDERGLPGGGDGVEGSPEELASLNLSVDQCTDPAENALGRITVSPRAQLYINSPDVLKHEQADNQKVGKWSFAYAMREILELPEPGTDSALLAQEQDAVDSFVSAVTGSRVVNASQARSRSRAAQTLQSSWGKMSDSNGRQWRTFKGAPFKLVAIFNRLDISKKGTRSSAGEGRFVYGFTGPGQLTVILEYDLVFGDASPGFFVKTPADWANKWQSLKAFLVDTDPARAGVQPDQRVTMQPQFTNKEGYIRALTSITELWANRNAKVRAPQVRGNREAAIAQIRTNEFINGDVWMLREISRVRLNGKPVLRQDTVKNNPDPEVWKRTPALASWIKTNTTCGTSDKNSCTYRTVDGKIPSNLPGVAGASRPLLGAESLADFSLWFPNPMNQADQRIKFFELQTCSGCHSSETNTPFLHVSPQNGEPSRFLVEELSSRVLNFKNLVCLGAATNASLDLVSEDLFETRRINVSNSTH